MSFHKNGTAVSYPGNYVSDEMTLDYAIEQSLLHWFLIVVGMMQLLEIVKVQKTIGQTVNLVEAVIVDVSGFVLFFVFWIIIFSFLQRIIGREVDRGDKLYRHVNEQTRFLLHTWIYSTGGGPTRPVDYNKWFEIDDAFDMEGGVKTEKGYSTIMIYLQWFTQILNQFYVNKILLSFLIAMIGKTFKGQMEAENKNGYNSRAALNAKCSVVMNAFNLLTHETDLVILSSNYKKPEKPNEMAVLNKKMNVCADRINKIEKEMGEFHKS